MEFAGEVQGSVAEGSAQLPQKLLAEALAEEEMGEKEGILAAGDPAGAIVGNPSAGNDTMQMRMQPSAPTIP